MEYLILYSSNRTQPEHQWTLLTTEGEGSRPMESEQEFPHPLPTFQPPQWLVSSELAAEVCSRRSSQKLPPEREKQILSGPLPSPSLQPTPTQFTNPALPVFPMPPHQETSSVLRSTASRATLGTSSRWGRARRWGLGPSLACRM